MEPYHQQGHAHTSGATSNYVVHLDPNSGHFEIIDSSALPRTTGTELGLTNVTTTRGGGEGEEAVYKIRDEDFYFSGGRGGLISEQNFAELIDIDPVAVAAEGVAMGEYFGKNQETFQLQQMQPMQVQQHQYVFEGQQQPGQSVQFQQHESPYELMSPATTPVSSSGSLNLSMLGGLVAPGAAAIQMDNNLLICNPSGQVIQIPLPTQAPHLQQIQIATAGPTVLPYQTTQTPATSMVSVQMPATPMMQQQLPIMTTAAAPPPTKVVSNGPPSNTLDECDSIQANSGGLPTTIQLEESKTQPNVTGTLLATKTEPQEEREGDPEIPSTSASAIAIKTEIPEDPSAGQVSDKKPWTSDNADAEMDIKIVSCVSKTEISRKEEPKKIETDMIAAPPSDNQIKKDGSQELVRKVEDAGRFVKMVRKLEPVRLPKTSKKPHVPRWLMGGVDKDDELLRAFKCRLDPMSKSLFERIDGLLVYSVISVSNL